MGIIQRPLKKPDMFRIHQMLQHISVDTSAIYDQLDINPKSMEDKNASLSMTKYFQLLELAATHHDRPYLGVDLALNADINNLGILSYMLNNAPNFSRALELLNKYIMLVSPGASTTLQSESNDSILMYKSIDTPAELCRQHVEATITQFIIMIRVMLKNEEWTPYCIYYEHSQPKNFNNNKYPLNCEIVFNHTFNGIRFSNDLINYPNTQFDTELLALLEVQASHSATELKQHESLIDHIRLLITSNLGIREITADYISTELGLSRRTLNRRLSENGTTFNTVKENIVFNIAKEELTNNTISITGLAQQLGYSDSSAFNRAFKRLSGYRPLEYRKAHSVI